MSRLKDPELLRTLKPIWRSFGCTICGRTVTEDVPPGFDIELAHFTRRSQGGPDDPAEILGMCGELTDCKAHARFDRYQLNIKRNDAGVFVWMSTAPGKMGWQECRIPPEMQDLIENPPGGALQDGAPAAPALLADNGSAVPRLSSPADPFPLPVADVPTPPRETLPAVVVQDPPAAGGQPYEQRYDALRGLVRRSERDRLAAAMLLWEAREQRDYERLDQSWPEFVASVGLSKSAASKMLKAAEVFRGEWLQLAQVDQSDLNLERLYLASRLVTEQGLGTMDALHEAVANPSHQLVAQLKGDEPADRCECTCPECGRKINHIKETAA